MQVFWDPFRLLNVCVLSRNPSRIELQWLNGSYVFLNDRKRTSEEPDMTGRLKKWVGGAFSIRRDPCDRRDPRDPRIWRDPALNNQLDSIDDRWIMFDIRKHLCQLVLEVWKAALGSFDTLNSWNHRCENDLEVWILRCDIDSTHPASGTCLGKVWKRKALARCEKERSKL